MDTFEFSKPQKVCVLFDNNIQVGWCQTWQEADFICDKLTHLQWDMVKLTKVSEELQLVVASEILQR